MIFFLEIFERGSFLSSPSLGLTCLKKGSFFSPLSSTGYSPQLFIGVRHHIWHVPSRFPCKVLFYPCHLEWSKLSLTSHLLKRSAKGMTHNLQIIGWFGLRYRCIIRYILYQIATFYHSWGRVETYLSDRFSKAELSSTRIARTTRTAFSLWNFSNLRYNSQHILRL